MKFGEAYKRLSDGQRVVAVVKVSNEQWLCHDDAGADKLFCLLTAEQVVPWRDSEITMTTIPVWVWLFDDGYAHVFEHAPGPENLAGGGGLRKVVGTTKVEVAVHRGHFDE